MRVHHVLTDIVENSRNEDGEFKDSSTVCDDCGNQAEVYYKWIIISESIILCKSCLSYAIKEIDRTILGVTKIEVLDEDDGYCD